MSRKVTDEALRDAARELSPAVRDELRAERGLRTIGWLFAVVSFLLVALGAAAIVFALAWWGA